MRLKQIAASLRNANWRLPEKQVEPPPPAVPVPVAEEVMRVGALHRRDLLNVFESGDSIAFGGRELAVLGARQLGDMRRDVFESADGPGYIVTYEKWAGETRWQMSAPLAKVDVKALAACDEIARLGFERIWKRG